MVDYIYIYIDIGTIRSTFNNAICLLTLCAMATECWRSLKVPQCRGGFIFLAWCRISAVKVFSARNSTFLDHIPHSMKCWVIFSNLMICFHADKVYYLLASAENFAHSWCHWPVIVCLRDSEITLRPFVPRIS